MPTESERDAMIAAAERCRRMTPRERMELFAELLRQEDEKLAKLSPEERLRQREIEEQLDPRPNPWWKNIRPDALPSEMRDKSSE